MRGNLLSVTKTTDQGLEIRFGKNEATISDSTGKVQAIAERIGNLYCLFEDDTREDEVMKFKTKTETNMARVRSTTWHSRLGHSSAENLQKIVPNVEKSARGKVCYVCAKGKMAAKKFPKRSETRAQNPLELVHSDVICVLRPEALQGYKYILTIIDYFSRFGVTYLTARKDEIFDKFKDYKASMENQKECRIKALRTGRGGEYMGNDFDTYLKENGIRRELTIPKTSAQNGVAERRHRQLANVVRCLLVESGLPLEF